MTIATELFTANGRTWQADSETLQLLRQYREQGNEYMVGAVFSIGQWLGRIKATETEPDPNVLP